MVLKRCDNCNDAGWVCENHRDRPWDATSNRADACGCGSGVPCPECVPKGERPDSDRYIADIICEKWTPSR